MPINFATARAALNHLLTGRIRSINRFGVVEELDDWFFGKEVLAAEYQDEFVSYFNNQPVMRSVSDFWPIPTIALCRTNFFYKQKSNSNRKVSINTLAKYYGNVCQICKNKFKTKDLTFDHVIPKSKGGTNDDVNLIPVCGPCNKLKADIFPYFDKDGNELKPKKLPNFLLPDTPEIRPEWEDYLIFSNKTNV